MAYWVCMDLFHLAYLVVHFWVHATFSLLTYTVVQNVHGTINVYSFGAMELGIPTGGCVKEGAA